MPRRTFGESLESGFRLGQAVRRTKDTREEREKSRAERQKKEAREVKAFEWKKEDREKQKKYEVVSKKFGVVKALHEAGKDREAAAMLSKIHNDDWPNGDESMVVFRSDTSNPKLRQSWDADPNLKGKELAVITMKGGVLPFKSMSDLMKYSAASLNQTEYLRGLKTAEASIAKMNAQEKPVRDPEDGLYYRRTWKLGPGGKPERGPKVPHKGIREATEFERKGLELKKFKEGGGRVTPAEEKEYRLGIKPPKKGKAVAPGKKRAAFKKDLDLLLRRFISKSGQDGDVDLGDDEEMTPAGKNALDAALNIVEKSKARKPLTPDEKKMLPYARKVADAYEVMSAETSAAYEPKETGKDWRQYRRTTGAATPPSPRLGMSPPLQRQSATPISPQYR